MGGEYRGPLLRATGARRTGGPWWVNRSEAVFGAELQSARVADDAAGLTVREARLTAGVEAPEVLVVEGVEQIERDAKRRAGELGEVLADPEVDLPVGEGVGDDEPVAVRDEAPTLVRAAAEPDRAPDVLAVAAAQRDQPAELDAVQERHVRDPIRNDVGFLVVGRVLRDVPGVGEGEQIAEPIGALDRPRGVRDRDA